MARESNLNSKNRTSHPERFPQIRKRVDPEVSSFITNSKTSSFKEERFYYDPDPQEYDVTYEYPKSTLENSGTTGSEIGLKNENTSKEEIESLSGDIFSLILVSDSFEVSFFVYCCIIFQYTLLCLLLSSIIDRKSTSNVLKIPPGNILQVMIAQLLTIFLAIFTADDLIGSLGFLYVGFDDNILKRIPRATRFRWFLAFFCKFIEGAICLAIIFILIVQSSTVIGLGLNFAALSFVWAIDDIFFSLAKASFFTPRIADAANGISDTKIPCQPNSTIHLRNNLLYLVMIVLVLSWAILLQQQLTGRFLCNNLLIQFDDSYEPVTPLFNGVYKKIDTRINGKVVYEGNRAASSTFVPVIAYCDEKEAWTLSFTNISDKHNPCDWVAHSPKTRSFDILTVPEKWLVSKYTGAFNSNNILVYGNYQNMNIECLDCVDGPTPSRNSCSYSGKCVNNMCVCDEGTFGISCEFTKPCDAIVPIGPSDNFPKWFHFGEKFTLLKKQDRVVEVKNRPIYYCDNSEPDGAPYHYGLYFFNGLRWVYVNSRSMDLKFSDTGEKNVAKELLIDFLVEEFHPYFSNYEGLLMSGPMYFSSPTDSTGPLLLPWYSVSASNDMKYPRQSKVDENFSYIQKYACAGCSDNQLCKNSGTCVNGTCKCTFPCTFGPLCEIYQPECNET